jgi:hypothetical protein
MEQLKRAFMNAAKRQMLKAIEQPETASREMQGRAGQTEPGATPQIGNAPDQRSVHKVYDISLWSLKHTRKFNQVPPQA